MTSRFYKKFPSQSGCFALLILLLAGLALSCNQDSIFADISVEPEFKEPRIAGTPTNIVVAKYSFGTDGSDGSDNTDDEWAVFAASTGSSTLHRYRGGHWDTSFSQPGGAIVALATDGETLYALSGDHMNAGLKKWDIAAQSWSAVNGVGGYSLQTIYGAGGKLFAGGKSGSTWKVFHVNGNNLEDVPGMSSVGMLTGAAESGGKYFIAVDNKGIYSTDLSASTEQVSSGHQVKGIIDIPVYDITLSQSGTYTFTPQPVGYTPSPSLPVTISNSGNRATGPLTAVLSGANADSFTLNSTPTDNITINGIAVSGSDTFTVAPTTTLPAGTYTATVTVSDGNNISAGFNVSFTVNPSYGIELSTNETYTFP
ncbi:MAG: hypothetical protein LBC62_10640, partial [Treponema sp.]|nr:hypothetical protein [Treponema sp.]